MLAADLAVLFGSTDPANDTKKRHALSLIRDLRKSGISRGDDQPGGSAWLAFSALAFLGLGWGEGKTNLGSISRTVGPAGQVVLQTLFFHLLGFLEPLPPLLGDVRDDRTRIETAASANCLFAPRKVSACLFLFIVSSWSTPRAILPHHLGG